MIFISLTSPITGGISKVESFFNIILISIEIRESGQEVCSMKVCPYCGTELLDGMNFCHHCGAKAGEAAVQVSSGPAEAISDGQTPDSNKSYSRWGRIIGEVLMDLAIAADLICILAITMGYDVPFLVGMGTTALFAIGFFLRRDCQ